MRLEPRRLTVNLRSRSGDGVMSVLEFGDPRRPVDMIFVHANGFNALTYGTLLAPLSASLRVWAPDLRGHGGTRLATQTKGRRGWLDHRDDLAALLDVLDGPPVILSGHSMGGTSALLAAAERATRVSGLVLFDPVIWSRHAVALFHMPFADHLAARIPLVRNAIKRRSRFASRDQAMAAYLGRGAFKGWPEAMLADYLTDGLIETDDGFALSCDPAWEASNYAAQGHNPWRALKRFRGPVHILRGETGSTCRMTSAPRGLAHVRVETVEGGNHFFPMLMPDVVRQALVGAAV